MSASSWSVEYDEQGDALMLHYAAFSIVHCWNYMKDMLFKEHSIFIDFSSVAYKIFSANLFLEQAYYYPEIRMNCGCVYWDVCFVGVEM